MEKETGKSKKLSKQQLLLIGAVTVIAIFFGVKVWINSMHHETTDNAQLDATITSVKSAVSGFVKEVRFVDNQEVKKGDTLVIIEDEDYRAKLLQAKAMLQSAQFQTSMSTTISEGAIQEASASSINSLAMQSNVDAAKARLSKSEKELSRIEKMMKDGAATQQQLDAAKAENQSASALYEMAQQQFHAAQSQASGIMSNAQAKKGQINVATALVEQRKAELELAETQLEHTIILAPYDGIVSKKNVEVGQLVQYGQPLCAAVQTNKLWVVANFKETQLDKIRVGQKVAIKLDAYKSIELEGIVESIGGATGAKFSLLPPDNATGNFVKVTQRIPVRIELNPFKNQEVYLAPGLSAFVDVEIN